MKQGGFDEASFRSQARWQTATGIPVPDEVVEGLGKRRRPPDSATINSHTYRRTEAFVGGQYMLPISAENREGVGVAAGDEVDVDIEPDTEPRDVAVPPGFAEALDAEARRLFDGLSYSKKQRFVLPIHQAKSDAAATHRKGVRHASWT